MARRKPQICKVDSNHGAIVNELRALGMSVQSLAKVANGAPDIAVGYAGVNLLVEIKVEGKKLNAEEIEWHATWLGQVATVTNSKQVVEVMETELKRRGIPHLPPAMLALLLL